MFDVLDNALWGRVWQNRWWWGGSALGDDVNRVVEMVRGIAKGVDLEFAGKLFGKICKQPVYNLAAFDTALAVDDQDNLLELRVFETLLDFCVARPSVLRGIRKVPLD